MSAIYISPGGTSGLPIFVGGTHADQVGINDNPANNQGFFSSGAWHLPGTANTYALTTAHNNLGFSVYTHVLQTDRSYDGTTDVRPHKGGIGSHVDIDNNDAAWNPLSAVSYGITSFTRVGPNGPSYGTVHGLSSSLLVVNQGHANNEYTPHFMIMVGGSYAQRLIPGGRFWFTDWALQGPIGTQPGLLNGISLVTNNFYNGSPTAGASAGCAIQSVMEAGGGSNYVTPATNYPVDIGYFASGTSNASDANGDGFTNAFQAGGRVGPWNGATGYGGDQGQIGRGFVVKAKNAGNSVSRLGAVVSEGTGEGGGLIFGLDTNDANRASIYRAANTPALSLRGSLAMSGPLGVNGSSPPAKASSPGTATGTDAAVINAIATILRNAGFCS